MWSTTLRPLAHQFSLALADWLLKGLRLLVLSLSTCLNSVSSVLPNPHGPLLFTWFPSLPQATGVPMGTIVPYMPLQYLTDTLCHTFRTLPPIFMALRYSL